MPDSRDPATIILKKQFRSAQAAFSFLTRLGPARIYGNAEMQGCPAWFPIVGIAMGTLLWFFASCISLLSTLCGAAAGGTLDALLTALLVIAADIWLTRGLHYDAAADVCDAMGAGAHGSRFAEILKDSRLGAFGAMGLAVAILARLLSVAALIHKDIAVALIPACCIGRVFLLLLPAFLEPAPYSVLGEMLHSPNASKRFWTWAVPSAAYAALTITPPAFAAASAACVFFSVFLTRTAARQEGYNGDFAGALCLACESSFLFFTALLG